MTSLLAQWRRPKRPNICVTYHPQRSPERGDGKSTEKTKGIESLIVYRLLSGFISFHGGNHSGCFKFMCWGPKKSCDFTWFNVIDCILNFCDFTLYYVVFVKAKIFPVLHIKHAHRQMPKHCPMKQAQSCLGQQKMAINILQWPFSAKIGSCSPVLGIDLNLVEWLCFQQN